MVKKIFIVLLVLGAGVVVFASTRPDNYHVERATRMAAPAAVIFAQLEDFKAWPTWSPWEKKDPQMTKTFSGPPTGVGSSYAWKGNKEVGSGRMSIVVSEPPSHIRYQLEFLEPFAAVAATGFTLVPQGDQTLVTWAMDGSNNFLGKVFSIFMDMNKLIGGDFETGLSALKMVAEQETARRAADQAKAAAVAAAAQAAAQAAARPAADAAGSSGSSGAPAGSSAAAASNSTSAGKHRAKSARP